MDPVITQTSPSASARGLSAGVHSDFVLSTLACLLILTAIWAAIYIPGLASPGLLDDADSVHADAARHMAETDDYVTLYTNNIRYLEKAPLTYWVVAITYKLF